MGTDNPASTADEEKPVWSWRDTLGGIAIFAWGAAFTTFSLLHLADGSLLVRRTLFDLFTLSVGLAGLYVAVGILVIRTWEIVGWWRTKRP